MDRPNATPVINFESKTKPKPIPTGRLRASLSCPLFGCPFLARNYHQFEIHIEMHMCCDCGFYVSRMDLHTCSSPGQRGGHVDGGQTFDESFFREKSRTLQGTVRSYIHFYEDESVKSATQAFEDGKLSIVALLEQLLTVHVNLLATFGLDVLMYRDEVDNDGNQMRVFQNFYFHCNNLELFAAGDAINIVNLAASEVEDNIQEFVRNGSGWRIAHIVSMEMRIAELELFAASRPKGFLPMPFKKIGYINFRNEDDHCFKYCCCCAMFMNELIIENESRPKFHKKKPSNFHTWKSYFSRLDWTAVKDGVELYGNMEDFELANNVRINVFSHRPDETIVLIRKSRATEGKVVNLFLIHENPAVESPEAKTHFAVITNLSAFFGHLSNGKKRVFCVYCLRMFASEKSCSDHEQVCNSNPRPALKFPKPGKVLKFGRFDMSLMSTLNLYFDFECLSVPVCESKGSYTSVHTEYKPASFALAVVYNSGLGLSLVDCEYHHAGEKTVNLFFERVFHHARRILTYIRATNNSLIPSATEIEQYRLSTECMYCKETFTEGFGITPAGQDAEEIEYDDDDLDKFFRDDFDEIDEDASNKCNEENGPSNKRVRKVWHHNHVDGRWFGPTCSRCNTYQRANHTVNVIGMNSTRFDNHMLVSGFASGLFSAKDVRVIARSAQEYVEIEISLDENVPNVGKSKIKNSDKASRGNRKVKVRFLDCLNFLVGSLSAQVDALRAENNPNFSLVQEAFPFMLSLGNGVSKKARRTVVNNVQNEDYTEATCCTDDDDDDDDDECVVLEVSSSLPKEPNPTRVTNENIDLLLEKLPYAYSYLDSYDKLSLETPMPSRSNYDNKLTGQACSDEEWEKIQNISQKFNIKNFGAWTKLYNVSDTILLAVVMETYRTKAYEKFQLDPLATCTNSSFSWACFLKSTAVELEYIRDPEMIKMLESAKRGGIAGCSKKICTANRPDMSNYKPGYPTVHIASCDLNSLYGKSMCYPLPQKDFQFIAPDTLKDVDWADEDIGRKLGFGFILTVDLEYTIEAQNLSKDIPFAPQKMVVKYSELSGRQQTLIDALGSRGKSFISQPKLILSHYDRHNYTLHYRELGLYLRLGMKLLNVHQALRFVETNYMEGYIRFNMQCRKEAKTPSESSYWKILSNGCYGRSLLSSKKMIEVKFASSRAESLKMLASPRLKSFKGLSDGLAMMTFYPNNPTFCYPIATGVSILGISKYIFYNGLYKQLKEIFGSSLVFQCWDTDGVVVNYTELDPGSFYKLLVLNRQLFDFSKLPKTHKIFTDYSNIKDLNSCGKSEPGLWKLESLDISEAISVKAKNYSLKYFTGQTESKLKGVNESAKIQCGHDKFRQVVQDPNFHVKVTVQQIRSFSHTLLGIELEKMALHGLDASRVYPTSDINLSFPFGCHELEKYCGNEKM